MSLIFELNVFPSSYEFAVDVDRATWWCEFYRVWLDIKENLLQSPLISADYVVVGITVYWKISKVKDHVDATELSLFFLDLNYFINGISDIEVGNVLSELARLELWKIKDVVD